jgi:hypothetical protein
LGEPVRPALGVEVDLELVDLVGDCVEVFGGVRIRFVDGSAAILG